MTEHWSCDNCGYHPGSRPQWCDAGCGPDYNGMSRALGEDIIAHERHRQIIGEGYSRDHDASHPWEMTEAAGCYLSAALATASGPNCVTFGDGLRPGEGVPRDWPWDSEAWKPTEDPIRNLVKAGALIVAEIDRLQS